MAYEKKIAIRDGPGRDEWLYNELRREGYKVSSHYFIKKDKVSALSGLANEHAANCELDKIAEKHEEECYFDESNKAAPSTKPYPTLGKVDKNSMNFWDYLDKVELRGPDGKPRKMNNDEKNAAKIILYVILAVFLLANPVFFTIAIILFILSKSDNNSQRKFR